MKFELKNRFYDIFKRYLKYILKKKVIKKHMPKHA